MLISSDRTGFPLIVVEEAAVEVHLLPITKIQFAQFMDESPTVPTPSYEEMLALNPKTHPTSFTAAERERLFISGVLPEEALAFARWLGPGFDLPTVAEWRDIYAVLRREPPPRHNAMTDFAEGAAATILQKIEAQLHVRSMRDFALMQGGLVEWVRQAQQMVGLGVPRAEFHPNLWDVLHNEIRPINPDQRVHYFGFRLVRRGDWYLSDKDAARFVF